MFWWWYDAGIIGSHHPLPAFALRFCMPVPPRTSESERTIVGIDLRAWPPAVRTACGTDLRRAIVDLLSIAIVEHERCLIKRCLQKGEAHARARTHAHEEQVHASSMFILTSCTSIYLVDQCSSFLSFCTWRIFHFCW